MEGVQINVEIATNDDFIDRYIVVAFAFNIIFKFICVLLEKPEGFYLAVVFNSVWTMPTYG